MADLLFVGVDPVTGKSRMYDSSTNMYSLSDDKPTQSQLDASNAALTYIGQSPVTGMVTYKDNETGKTVYTGDHKIPTSLAPERVNDSPAPLAEIKSEVSEVPIPGGGTAKVLTVQSDSLFKGAGPMPAAAAAGVASAQQKASEIARAVGGQGTAPTVTPQNAASNLINPKLNTDSFTAKLVSKQTGASVIFYVTPVIDESRSANYEHLSPVHHPGTIQVYKNTESRQFNISAKLIARVSNEASQNIEYINRIRAWLMPYYGKGTANGPEAKRLGAPPDVLLFSVYGDSNISNVPVVLTSYHWVYPDQVDFIPSNEGIPFPTIMDISLSLVESYSPEQFSNFNIIGYRRGDMVGAYDFGETPTLPDDANQAN